MVRILGLVCLAAAQVASAASRPCAGGTDVGTFRLYLLPPGGGTAKLDIRRAGRIPAGARLVCEPARRAAAASDKAQVAAVLTTAGSNELAVLEPRLAGARAEWKVPAETAVVALVYGPQGLNMGKVKSLMGKHEELPAQLADFADQNSQVEALVETLAGAEQSGGVNAALSGFSLRYGVSVPKLDAKASTDQQAATLLSALLPSMTSYDPLAPRTAVMQQSAGLAASVAGLFFGNPVGLAAGGAALFQNLRTAVFPETEFRTAFAQGAGTDELSLCGKAQPAKSRTRLAYLWAHRAPNPVRPKLALAGDVHLPLAAKSLVKVRVEAGKLRDLQLAREWRLVPVGAGGPVAVAVAPAGTDTLEVDLGKAKLAPGEYGMAASWDWETLTVPGRVYLHPFSRLAEARLTPESHDRLTEGSGTVAATFTGPDFEFVEKAAVERLPKRQANPAEVTFTLAGGKRGGPQNRIVVELDTAARGDYRLLLTQGDGLTHEAPFTVLPPDPKLAPLPIRLNAGEAKQAVRLAGTGVEQVVGFTTPAGAVEGRAVALKADAKPGDKFDILLKVKGREQPLRVAGGFEVVGPRPRVTAARKSLPAGLGIVLADDELPAASEVGIGLTVERLPADRPDIRLTATLACAGGPARTTVPLTGTSGQFFLSIDPGAVGYPGCRLTATVAVEPEGASDPFPLGRVLRVPRVEQFTLTDEQLAPGTWAGVLKGKDLDTIEKAGWDAGKGLPVPGIPTPVPGEAGKQTLRIALPWPSPAPHSPVYLWLRGENAGRRSVVRY